jgi:hypothetical protein
LWAGITRSELVRDAQVIWRLPPNKSLERTREK